MRINSICASGIYAKNAVAMKARKSEEAIFSDFKNFMTSNNLVLNATLTPTKKGFYTEIELSKKQGYNLVHVTDEDGYGVTASGKNVKEAVLEMAKKYRGQELYINSSFLERFRMPQCV